MARLLEAVRPQARLILVGDPGQLTSIEAGAVLGDIVGPADDGPSSAGIVVLSRVHRFGGAIGAVAEAVRRGDADAAVQALSTSPDEVTWLPVDPETDSALAPVHDGAVGAARAVIEAARAGDAHRALEALVELPRPVRAPPRPVRRRDLDRPHRALARQRGRRLRRRGAVVRRPAAARDRERLRPAPLQRRHRGRRGDATPVASAPRSSAAASSSSSARPAWRRSTASTR